MFGPETQSSGELEHKVSHNRGGSGGEAGIGGEWGLGDAAHQNCSVYLLGQERAFVPTQAGDSSVLVKRLNGNRTNAGGIRGLWQHCLLPRPLRSDGGSDLALALSHGVLWIQEWVSSSRASKHQLLISRLPLRDQPKATKPESGFPNKALRLQSSPQIP